MSDSRIVDGGTGVVLACLLVLTPWMPASDQAPPTASAACCCCEDGTSCGCAADSDCCSGASCAPCRTVVGGTAFLQAEGFGDPALPGRAGGFPAAPAILEHPTSPPSPPPRVEILP